MAIVQNPDPSVVPRELSPPPDEKAGPLNPLSAKRREMAKDGIVWAYIESGGDSAKMSSQKLKAPQSMPRAIFKIPSQHFCAWWMMAC